jgi:lipid II isoglutaminyl synthase (glutamine-hydrolysing)
MTMANRKLIVGYLYPDIMSGYGDRGNVATIVRRCGWRGITAEVWELRLGDPVVADEVDLLMLGHGGEFHQRLIAADLVDVKAPGICEAVAQGAALLAVGAGYELLGRFYQPSMGVELPGAGLFDAWTIQHGDDLATASYSITEARAGRAIGDLLVRWGDELLVGFENHSAKTYLGPTAQGLGEVILGQGNNGDGGEGVRLGCAVGTYLRGPCLPRNPVLADFLIRGALLRRYRDCELEPLRDELEHAAHDTAISRLRACAGSISRPRRRIPSKRDMRERRSVYS